jgi:23S rRNA (guanosine2251-2'-O)-methyltransferase
VSSSRERNDRSRPGAKPFSKGPPRPQGHAHRGPRRKASEIGTDWLWGWHAVEAALENPARGGFRRLLVSPARLKDIEAKGARRGLRAEPFDVQDIGRQLPPGAVHQGVGLLADPLEPLALHELADSAKGLLLMLDQLTDPQNVGAIFRSAAAFGARGVILQERHAPALSGALAKAAAGAVDRIPHARAVNLSRALEELAEAGWRTVGLDGEAPGTLDETLDGRPTVLVLGSEGEGIRRLVAEHCDALCRIPMPGGFESLNVSAAAAVALYAAARAQG